MYIKLTKLDGNPIWINAAFVVTVEPRKLGGAIVVPIGDGLDYDVRETPEQVLAALEGAPVAAVVPVPPPKSLAPAPADVSPEDNSPTASAGATESAPAKKTRARTKKSADAVEKLAKKTRARTSKKATVDAPAPADPVPPADAVPAPSDPPSSVADVAPAGAEKSETLSAEQIERLRKMAPRSMKKLTNTLYSQFRVRDAGVVIATLAAQGVFAVDQGRVLWSYASAPVAGGLPQD